VGLGGQYGHADSPERFRNDLGMGLLLGGRCYGQCFFSLFHYGKLIMGENLVSTQLIYDGKMDIHTHENGMVNFRNVRFPV